MSTKNIYGIVAVVCCVIGVAIQWLVKDPDSKLPYLGYAAIAAGIITVIMYLKS